MTKIWWAIALASLVIGALAFGAGYLPWWSPSDFEQNILAEVFGLGIAFGLAILLIEGQILTQQTRRRKIVTRAAKSTLEFADEIGMRLTWELGIWLVSVLESSVDLYGEQRGNDWDKDIKPLLRLVYDEVERVKEPAMPRVALTCEDYRSHVEALKDFARQIRQRMETNLEVNEMLLELGEKLDELDKCLTRSMWATSAANEVEREMERFHWLGSLGNTMTYVMETIDRLYRRL
jgi:hypothetical protein